VLVFASAFALAQTLRQNGGMEPHPHNQPASIEVPAEEIPDKLPLATRVIAGVLRLMGTLSVLDVALQLLFRGSINFNLSVMLLPIGWGALRGREWGRVWATFVCALVGGFGFLLAALAWLVEADQISMTPDPGDIGDIPRRIVFSLVGLTVAGLASLAVRQLSSLTTMVYCQRRAATVSFVNWNPREWRFSIGSLLFLTVLVAFAANRLSEAPIIQRWRVQAAGSGTTSADLLKGLPPLPTGDGTVHESASVVIEYGYHTPSSSLGIPKLDYAILRQRNSAFFGLSHQSSPLTGRISRLDDFEQQTFSFPGKIQLVEINGDTARSSKMRITFPELWNFLHSKKPRTLGALEQHVQDLRNGENASE